MTAAWPAAPPVNADERRRLRLRSISLGSDCIRCQGGLYRSRRAQGRPPSRQQRSPLQGSPKPGDRPYKVTAASPKPSHGGFGCQQIASLPQVSWLAPFLKGVALSGWHLFHPRLESHSNMAFRHFEWHFGVRRNGPIVIRHVFQEVSRQT